MYLTLKFAKSNNSFTSFDGLRHPYPKRLFVSRKGCVVLEFYMVVINVRLRRLISKKKRLTFFFDPIELSQK